MKGLSVIAASGQWAPDKSERRIPQLSPLLNYLEREKRAFVRDDVVSSRNSFALAARKEARELGGDAVLPLVQDQASRASCSWDLNYREIRTFRRTWTSSRP